MHDFEKKAVTDKGDWACIISFRCSNKNILKLIDYFDGSNSLCDLIDNKDAEFECSIFPNTGGTMEVKNFYNYKKIIPSISWIVDCGKVEFEQELVIEAPALFSLPVPCSDLVFQ